MTLSEKCRKKFIVMLSENWLICIATLSHWLLSTAITFSSHFAFLLTQSPLLKDNNIFFQIIRQTTFNVIILIRVQSKFHIIPMIPSS